MALDSVTITEVDASVNLTSLGATDYWTTNSALTIIRKTGGGSLITVNPFWYDTWNGSAWDQDDYTLQAWDDYADIGSGLVTTTDGTPSNVTSSNTIIYNIHYQGMGLEFKYPVVAGSREIDIATGFFILDGAKTGLKLRIVSPSLGELYDEVITGLSAGVEEIRTINIAYTSLVSETLTVMIYSPIDQQYGDNIYMAVRWVHLGAVESSGNTGSANITLAPLTTSSAAKLTIESTASINLAPLTTSSNASLGIDAVAGITFAPLTTTSNASLGIDATAGITFAPLTTTAAGELSPIPIIGSANITLAPLTTSSGGSLSINADAGINLAPLTTLSNGSLGIDGTVSATLAALTTTSAASLGIDGIANMTFAPLTVVSAGALDYEGISGDVNITFAPLTTVSAASLSITGAAGITLQPLTSQALASLLISGTGEGNLQPLTVAAVGIFGEIVEDEIIGGTGRYTFVGKMPTKSRRRNVTVEGYYVQEETPEIKRNKKQKNISVKEVEDINPISDIEFTQEELLDPLAFAEKLNAARSLVKTKTALKELDTIRQLEAQAAQDEEDRQVLLMLYSMIT